MIAELMQRQLQEIYDLELSYNVNDFLITDKDRAKALDTSVNSRDLSEKLLVYQDQDELWVSLYLAEEVLDALTRNNPYEQLDESNVSDFCTALEGVSHFIYLTWNANHERPVSQLELELQAEVDKFVSVYSLAKDQATLAHSRGLYKWLFEQCQFHSDLCPNERERYQVANKSAAEFCKRLEQHTSDTKSEEKTSRELRRFYRKRHLDKLTECGSPLRITSP